MKEIPDVRTPLGASAIKEEDYCSQVQDLQRPDLCNAEWFAPQTTVEHENFHRRQFELSLKRLSIAWAEEISKEMVVPRANHTKAEALKIFEAQQEAYELLFLSQWRQADIDSNEIDDGPFGRATAVNPRENRRIAQRICELGRSWKRCTACDTFK